MCTARVFKRQWMPANAFHWQFSTRDGYLSPMVWVCVGHKSSPITDRMFLILKETTFSIENPDSWTHQRQTACTSGLWSRLLCDGITPGASFPKTKLNLIISHKSQEKALSFGNRRQSWQKDHKIKATFIALGLNCQLEFAYKNFLELPLTITSWYWFTGTSLGKQ